MTPRLFIIYCAFYFPVQSFGQGNKTLQWLFTTDPVVRNETQIKFTANVNPGWHLYSQFLEEGGPMPTIFIFETSNDYQIVEKVKEQGKQTKFRDKTFAMEITWYTGKVVFLQKLKVYHLPAQVKGRIEFMTCNNEVCIPGTQDFVIDLQTPK